MSPDSAKSSLKIKNTLAVVLITIMVGVMLSSNISKGPFNETGQVLGIYFSGISQFLSFSSTFSFIFKSQGLSNIVQNNLSGKSGKYAVYIADLSDGENYTLRSSDIYPAASLYKLYLLAAVMREVETGNLKLEDNLSAKKDYLVDVFNDVDFGYEDFEDDEIIEYTVEKAMERVGRVSNNFAAIMLAEKIGWDNVQQAAFDSGSSATTIKSPISTTAADVANFLKLLYQDKIVSPNASVQIREFLKLSQLNDRIPAGLPEDVEVVHKTGELARVRHDAGIVYLESTSEVKSQNTSEVYDRAYVIVMMSKDLKDENEAVETMANISKEVYLYFRDKR